MAILTTGNTFASGDQVTAATLNSAVNDAEFAAGAVDNTSTQLSGTSPQQIIVKDAGISTGKIATGAVTTAKIASDVVINTSGSITGAAGSFTTLSASGDVNFDSNTLFVDASANNVGIGSSAPDKRLVVAGVGSEIVIDDTDATDTPRLRFRESGATSGGVSTDAGELIFDSGTTERVRIDSSGNVGINTNNPAELLHVKSSNSDTAETVAGFGNGDIDVGLEIKTNGNGGSSLDWGFNAVNARNLVFDTNQTERMRISSNGNVGIGTDPSHKLDVNSGATNQVALFESTDATAYIELADNTGSVQFITPSSGALRITTGGAGAGSVGTSGLFIDQSQNVGIGDDTPSYKLDVNGTGRFVNDLTLDEELIHNLSGAGSLPGYSAGTFGAVLEDGGTNGSSLYMSRKNSWALYLATDTTLNAQSDKVVQFADLNGQVGDQDNVVGSITITSSSTA